MLLSFGGVEVFFEFVDSIFHETSFVTGVLPLFLEHRHGGHVFLFDL